MSRDFDSPEEALAALEPVYRHLADTPAVLDQVARWLMANGHSLSDPRFGDQNGVPTVLPEIVYTLTACARDLNAVAGRLFPVVDDPEGPGTLNFSRLTRKG